MRTARGNGEASETSMRALWQEQRMHDTLHPPGAVRAISAALGAVLLFGLVLCPGVAAAQDALPRPPCGEGTPFPAYPATSAPGAAPTVIQVWQAGQGPRWQAIATGMVDSAIRSGFDGAYLDWVQGYADPSVAAAAMADGVDPKAELIRFVGALRAHALAAPPGFRLVAQNAAELGRDPAWTSMFDAVAQEDLTYHGDAASSVLGDQPRGGASRDALTADLDAWRAAGKAVFTVDYATDAQHAADAYAYSSAHRYVPFVTTLFLDRATSTPPPDRSFGPAPNHGASQAHSVSVIDTTQDASFSYSVASDDYAGPLGFLRSQYVYSGTHAMVIAARDGSAFLHGGPADDALAASSGSNVLDGGAGSNFMIGATGTDGGADTFYADLRSPAVVWDTLINFHAGDDMTLWGYVAGVSSWRWDGVAGANGYQGATMRADVQGVGAVQASVTFAGMSMDQASKLLVTSGSVAGQPFLHMQAPP